MFGVAIIYLSNITGCLISVFAEDHVIQKVETYTVKDFISASDYISKYSRGQLFTN